MEREALKLALEALGKAKRQIVHAKVAPHGCIGDAITAIKEALAQPEQEQEQEQEPVAWMYDWFCDDKLITGWIAHSEPEIPKSMALNIRPLYTTPPQRTWVGPTGNEWFEWWRISKVADATEAEIDFADFLIIAQSVSAKLKEDNK